MHPSTVNKGGPFHLCRFCAREQINIRAEAQAIRLGRYFPIKYFFFVKIKTLAL